LRGSGTSRHGRVAETFTGDLAEEKDAAACVARAVEVFGKLDIFVNNAGVFPEIAECQDFSIENFDYTIRNMRTGCIMFRLDRDLRDPLDPLRLMRA
jgi:NAD(P)-dependent dehydrogenase (short-subunit alcohol dehydrogenase family)